MQNQVITNDVFSFLKKLEKNNNREWFTEHKSDFKNLESEMKLFFNALADKVKSHDELEKVKVFRIYRDVRFSKDKTPYKKNFSCSFTRAGVRLRGGYYVHIQPGNESFLAAGFWQPNKEDLLRIRKELELDASEFKNVIDHITFKNIWGNLVGEELKTAPKGFDKEHNDIELIRKKQFIFIKKFTDKEVLQPNFIENANKAFVAIKPYFDLMSDILTTNLNGESLLD